MTRVGWVCVKQWTSDTVSSDVCAAVGSVLLMDEAKNDTMPLLSNGGPDVAISMDGVGGDKQRYHQQLQLIDEQVFIILTPFHNDSNTTTTNKGLVN